MKTYKINNVVIQAKSLTDAVKFVKDSVNDELYEIVIPAGGSDAPTQSEIQRMAAHWHCFVKFVKSSNPNYEYDAHIRGRQAMLRGLIFHNNIDERMQKIQDSVKDDLGIDVSEYQKWVDYDMKRYHKISGDTMYKIKKAGLDVVKDRYGDYEVIAHRRDEEKVEDDGEEDISYLSKEEEQAIDDYRKAIANTKDPLLLRVFSHILKEEIEHLEELGVAKEEVEDSVKDNRYENENLAKEINRKFVKELNTWDGRVYADVDGLDLSEISASKDTTRKIIEYVKAKGKKVSYTSDDAFLQIHDSVKDGKYDVVFPETNFIPISFDTLVFCKSRKDKFPADYDYQIRKIRNQIDQIDDYKRKVVSLFNELTK